MPDIWWKTLASIIHLGSILSEAELGSGTSEQSEHAGSWSMALVAAYSLQSVWEHWILLGLLKKISRALWYWNSHHCRSVMLSSTLLGGPPLACSSGKSSPTVEKNRTNNRVKWVSGQSHHLYYRTNNNVKWVSGQSLHLYYRTNNSVKWVPGQSSPILQNRV